MIEIEAINTKIKFQAFGKTKPRSKKAPKTDSNNSDNINEEIIKKQAERIESEI